MTQAEIEEQARYIFTVSKRMRDHIHRIQMQAHARQGQTMGDDISVAQMHTLMIVKRFGNITISRLAAMLDVSVPSASTMVDRLVEKKLLERMRKEDDRRVVVVELTRPATLFIEQIEDMVLTGFMTIVYKVGPEIAAKWCEVLDSVDKVLHEEGK